MIKYFFSFVLITCLFHARAQDVMISLNTSYNIPRGNMKWSYKPALGVQLSGLAMNDSKRWTTGLGMGIGYVQFDPIADTLYYVADRGGVGGLGLGKAVYSPFKILKISALLMATRKLNKKLGAELSMEVAYCYGKRDIQFTDEFGGQDGVSELVTRGAFVPKAGLSYSLGDRWSVVPFIAYTLMIEIGDTNPQAMNYNADTGKSLSFYSTGLALNFLF